MSSRYNGGMTSTTTIIVRTPENMRTVLPSTQGLIVRSVNVERELKELERLGYTVLKVVT